MKQAFLALAASYFASYPGENKIFFTSDKQAFFSENDATNHGKSLRKKESDEVEVTAVTREEAEAATKEAKAATPKGGKKGAAAESTEENAEAGTAGADSEGAEK